LARVVFNKFIAIAVLAVLLFATGIKIHSAFTIRRVSDWNYTSLRKIDKTSRDFSFAAFGDNKNSITTFDKLIEDVNAGDDLFALDDGDLVFDGELEKYNFFLNQIERLNKPLLTAIGNHELYANGRGNYYDIFGPFYYSFTVGRSYFIVLDDANQVKLDPWQMEWLRGELEKSRSYRYRFVFMHVPLYDTRTSGLALEHGLKDASFARKLNALFDSYDLTMLFTSHIHEYDRGVWGKTPYIITGGAGGELAGNDPKHDFFHYIRVHVSDAGVSYDVVKLKPTVAGWISKLVFDAWVYIYAFFAIHYADLVIDMAILYFLLYAAYVLDKRKGWSARWKERRAAGRGKKKKLEGDAERLREETEGERPGPPQGG
jgi:hypothetical protein